MARQTKPRARGLTVWKGNNADAPTQTLTAEELIASWKACQYSSEEKMSAPDAPSRVAHAPWPNAYAIGLHIIVCMGLGFDGTAGKFTDFLDWELGGM